MNQRLKKMIEISEVEKAVESMQPESLVTNQETHAANRQQHVGVG